MRTQYENGGCVRCQPAILKILSKNVIIWTGFSYQEVKLEGMSSPPLRYMLSVSALGSMEKPTAQKVRVEMDQINGWPASQEYLGTCLWAVS